MISNDLGIVVIGRNEGKRLIKCLNSVKGESDATIVYVDSGSTDGSVAAAECLGVAVLNLDMSRPFTAARARNEGFAALMAVNARVQFVQFIDGDCELVSGWLETALTFIRHRNDVAVVCGRRRERYPETSIYNRLCDFEWNTPVGEAAACGGDAIIRSEAFKMAEGYQSQLIAGEEPELCLRLREMGWKIWRLDAEMTRHDAAITRFGEWWVRTVRSGYAYGEIAQLHKYSKFRIYRDNVRRAVIWGGLIPLLICLGAIAHPAVVAGGLIYPIQMCRISSRIGGERSAAWNYALFVLIAKFAELQGITKYYLYHLSGNAAALIEYKKAD